MCRQAQTIKHYGDSETPLKNRYTKSKTSLDCWTFERVYDFLTSYEKGLLFIDVLKQENAD